MKADYNDLIQELWLRMRNSGEIRWKTRNGEEIPIKDMSDSHLMNAIHMLEKQEELWDKFDIDALQ